MRPVVISFRKLFLPDIKRSDYDESGKGASGYEVSGIDATIPRIELALRLFCPETDKFLV